MTDIIALAIVIVAAVLGLLLGFHRLIKVLTGGLFGIIIGIVVCAMIGGSLQNLDVSQQFIASVNQTTTEWWAFLSYLKLGYVAFYLVLFLLVQIVRVVIVKIISNIAASESPIIVFINKSLGLVISVVFVSAVILLALAGIRALDGTDFGQSIIAQFEDSYLKVIYENNPIKF
ncbi:MAG: hypothetical protein WC292_07405 [Clostridia bacterium]